VDPAGLEPANSGDNADEVAIYLHGPTFCEIKTKLPKKNGELCFVTQRGYYLASVIYIPTLKSPTVK